MFTNDKKIVISNYPTEKVKKKYGFRFEILNSIKDENAIDVITERIKKQYPLFILEKYIFKKRVAVFSEETRKKMSLSKLGKPRDEVTRKKISAGLKGRSNFQGKKHKEESKEKIAEAKLGNQHNKNTYWIHDPSGDTEKKVKDRNQVPKGFSLGRDYYSTEPGLYYFKKK